MELNVMKYVHVQLLIAIGSFALVFIQHTIADQVYEKDWWQTTIFYQIYPRSFMDSDGDGIGDINGITMKLNHLVDTGIGATWLSPIFDSPMIDFGYDISNFTNIHPEYGTIDDFDRLVEKAKGLRIKIILDFVPNHTSDKCEWFQKSIKREPGYENMYIWHDGIELVDNEERDLLEIGEVNERKYKRFPPNNWVSVFYGSAWTWNEERRQYYLHQFTKNQPDLNYRNPIVVQRMEDVMKFWLYKGVDGFRVDAINHLFEVEDFKDEPPTGLDSDPNSYGYLHHYYTKDLLESTDMIFRWRKLLDNWKSENGGSTRIIMTEAYANITSTIEFYGSSSDYRINGAQIPFNFLLITDIDEMSDARDVVFIINKWLSYMPNGKEANWVLGNHDKSRVGTRFGENRIDAMNVMLLTLPGISITYNGEEIGMLDNTDISWEDTKDPAALNTNSNVYMKYSRDPVRTPFQWNCRKNSGFSTSDSTWLPVSRDYHMRNLEAQTVANRSHYNLYRQLAKEIRTHNTMQYGHFHPIAVNKFVLAYTRSLKHHDTFVVVINFSGNTSHTVNLECFNELPQYLVVVASATHSSFRIGDIIDRHQINVCENDAIILKSPPHSSNYTTGHSNIYGYTTLNILQIFSQSLIIAGTIFFLYRYNNLRSK